MNKERDSYKDQALSSLSRGEWEKALQSLQKHIDKKPEDLRSRLKKAELLERIGKKQEAIVEYRAVAEAYAGEGFLLQAISVNKMILRMDPSLKEINERLAQLYVEKNRETKSSRPLPYIPFLSELNEDELRSLLGRLQTGTFPKEVFLCHEGDPGDSLMVICRGIVGVFKEPPGGKEVWIRNLKEGDCFGEFGFFSDRKRHAGVKTLTECEVLEISRIQLEEIIETHPRVREVLEDLFQKRVWDLLFASSPLVSSLGLPEREEVFRRFHPLNIPEETIVFKGGEPPRCLYLIKNGEVELFTQDRRGRRVTLERLGSGHLFGEIGLFLNKPRTAFARTTRPTELLELTKEDFDHLLRKFPQLQSVVKEFSSKRLVRMKEILSQEWMERTKESMV
jgi:cAMP-dependent protein kinase regulator